MKLSQIRNAYPAINKFVDISNLREFINVSIVPGSLDYHEYCDELLGEIVCEMSKSEFYRNIIFRSFKQELDLSRVNSWAIKLHSSDRVDGVSMIDSELPQLQAKEFVMDMARNIINHHKNQKPTTIDINGSDDFFSTRVRKILPLFTPEYNYIVSPSVSAALHVIGNVKQQFSEVVPWLYLNGIKIFVDMFAGSNEIQAIDDKIIFNIGDAVRFDQMDAGDLKYPRMIMRVRQKANIVDAPAYKIIGLNPYGND